MTDAVPEFFSAKRARYISGAGRKRVEALPKHGPFKQVARADVEHLLMRDKAITPSDWDRATLRLHADKRGRD